MCDVTLCSKKFQIVSTGKTFCPTYSKTEFKADVKSNGTVKIFGTPALKGLEPFEVMFQIDDELKSYLMDEEDEDDEF